MLSCCLHHLPPIRAVWHGGGAVLDVGRALTEGGPGLPVRARSVTSPVLPDPRPPPKLGSSESSKDHGLGAAGSCDSERRCAPGVRLTVRPAFDARSGARRSQVGVQRPPEAARPAASMRLESGPAR